MFPKIPHVIALMQNRIDCVRLRADFIRNTSEIITKENNVMKISNGEIWVKPTQLKIQSYEFSLNHITK